METHFTFLLHPNESAIRLLPNCLNYKVAKTDCYKWALAPYQDTPESENSISSLNNSFRSYSPYQKYGKRNSFSNYKKEVKNIQLEGLPLFSDKKTLKIVLNMLPVLPIGLNASHHARNALMNLRQYNNLREAVRKFEKRKLERKCRSAEKVRARNGEILRITSANKPKPVSVKNGVQFSGKSKVSNIDSSKSRRTAFDQKTPHEFKSIVDKEEGFDARVFPLGDHKKSIQCIRCYKKIKNNDAELEAHFFGRKGNEMLQCEYLNGGGEDVHAKNIQYLNDLSELERDSQSYPKTGNLQCSLLMTNVLTSNTRTFVGSKSQNTQMKPCTGERVIMKKSKSLIKKSQPNINKNIARVHRNVRIQDFGGSQSSHCATGQKKGQGVKKTANKFTFLKEK